MVKLYIKVLWPGVDPSANTCYDNCYNVVKLKQVAEVKKYYEALRKEGYNPTLIDMGKNKNGVREFRLRYSSADWARMVIEEMELEKGAK